MTEEKDPKEEDVDGLEESEKEILDSDKKGDSEAKPSGWMLMKGNCL